MLAVAWDALNDAIPRLQAEEKLTAYQVAVLATPTSDRSASYARERVVQSWLKLLEARVRATGRSAHMSVARLRDRLLDAFKEQIKE